MKTISMNELKQNIDPIFINAASGIEYVKVRVGKEISAVIIDDREWKILCDAFALLTGSVQANHDFTDAYDDLLRKIDELLNIEGGRQIIERFLASLESEIGNQDRQKGE